MADDINGIVEALNTISIDALVEGAKNVVTPTLQELKIAASNYLALTDSLSGRLLDFTQLLKRQKALRKSVNNDRDKLNTIDEYVKNKSIVSSFLTSDIPRQLYEASFAFQNTLNAYLGQQVEMVIVMDGASGPELYRIKSEDILKFDYSSSGALVARYNTTLENLQRYCQQISLDNDKLNFSLSGLKATYSEILYRYRVSKSHGNHIVLWNPNGTWRKMSVSAEGDINEAYAAFIFLNKTDPSFMKDLENNIGDFLTAGVAQVDNISGLLQGDVTVGNLELGIKSAGASTLGLKQIQVIAKKIVSENFDETSLAKIKANLAAKGKTRNKIQEGVIKNIEDILAEIQAR